MKQVLEAALEVQRYCEERDWRFCFIGGIAVLGWGIPRNTNDVDITLLTGIGGEEHFISAFLEKFESRIAENPLAFFVSKRIILARVGDVGIDVSLGALEFEQSAVSRAKYFELIPGIALRICSAEDLIVFKAFANRLRDWADVESVIKVQTNIDWEYVYTQLKPLVALKEEPEIISQLESLREKIHK